MEELGRKFVVCIPETIVGIGTSDDVGTIASERGVHKTLIVTDAGVDNAGLVESIEASLRSKEIPFLIFDGCKPNGPTEVIDECAGVVKKEGCDSVIGVGGGSVMDTAKVASVLATNDEDVHNFIGRDKVKKPGLFKVLIPATAGTGSEWSDAAIVTDARDGQKKPIFSRYMWSDLVIIDPLMSLNLPPKVTADTGIDALTHAIEAYAAWKSNVVSDMFAEKTIQLVSNNLRIAYAKGRKHIEARYNLCIAAAFGIAAHTSSSAGLIHSMNYPLTEKSHVSHGTALALLLPHVMEFNLPGCPAKYAKIAEIMGENIEGCSQIDAARKSVEAVRRLCRDVGMPQRMGEVGFDKGDIPSALDFLFEFQLYGMENNARDVTREDIARIYEAAL